MSSFVVLSISLIFCYISLTIAGVPVPAVEYFTLSCVPLSGILIGAATGKLVDLADGRRRK